MLEFFNSLPDRQGWSLIQFNFTVGVRGSNSTEDRTDPLSFVSTLKALGISSQVNLEKIRKRVAKRTFEAHDMMLRSYYAVKFSSPSSVDFSRLLGNSFALQHCLRLPIDSSSFGYGTITSGIKRPHSRYFLQTQLHL